MQIRTDLALEAREIDTDNSEGLDFTSEKENGLCISNMKIKTESASKRLGKPCGNYITIEMPPLTADFTETDDRILTISEQIEKLIPDSGTVLVVGIGNINITPDALGPKTAKGVLATRHITGELAKEIGLDGLRSVAVIAPGVLGQTGIETGELILSVINRIRPSAVIAIDALASRRLQRLGCTLQISDTGIAPGAGVGNHRSVINKEKMGVPVISIGVPTVVDAVTLAADLLMPDNEDAAEAIRSEVSPGGRQMVVTPREIDLLIERSSRLTAMAINCALQPLSQSDLLSLVN